MAYLYSLCTLSDGIHWLMVSPDGTIFESSSCGFASEDDALLDLKYRN